MTTGGEIGLVVISVRRLLFFYLIFKPLISQGSVGVGDGRWSGVAAAVATKGRIPPCFYFNLPSVLSVGLTFACTDTLPGLYLLWLKKYLFSDSLSSAAAGSVPALSQCYCIALPP